MNKIYYLCTEFMCVCELLYRLALMREQMIKAKNRYLNACFCLLFGVASSNAQQLIGTQGMMNIPTADMCEAGTFNGGASFVGESVLAQRYNYDTGIYYVDFTPFSWMEITLRETLLKTTKTVNGVKKRGFYQQDRSTSLRLRPLKEKEGKWMPSVLVGCNDIYSDHGDSYYTAVYGTVTKHVDVQKLGTFGATVGYAHPFRAGCVYDGVFGGVEFRPKGVRCMRVMAEYDTQGFNVGVSALLFRHLNLMVMTREFDKICAGVSYQYTIKY